MKRKQCISALFAIFIWSSLAGCGGGETGSGLGANVRRYLWNELSEYEDVVAETDGTGAPAATYTLGGSDLIQQTGNGNLNAAYFLRDGLGSVIGLTGPAGTETDSYRYDAWGTRTSSSGITANNYLYRGQRTDEVSSLLYLRTRYLSPGIGRFITRDTAAFDLDNPVDLNRYRYAASNPINDYDPTGYQDAAEYGMLAKEEAENAEIEGYLVGRRDETWISCMAMLLSAMFARILEDQIWSGLKNKVVFAFGHVVKAPLDAMGKDYQFSPADPEGRKVLLAKAAMFQAANREEAFATSGFKISRQIQDIINNFTGRLKFVGGTDTGSADPCANHAELKIKAYENPPTNTIESIAASIPVCVNCHLQLYPWVECIVPFGTNTRCLKGPILGQ
jgi:RHS repeat-associated protein